jgi:hypothetical protein
MNAKLQRTHMEIQCIPVRITHFFIMMFYFILYHSIRDVSLTLPVFCQLISTIKHGTNETNFFKVRMVCVRFYHEGDQPQSTNYNGTLTY